MKRVIHLSGNFGPFSIGCAFVGLGVGWLATLLRTNSLYVDPLLIGMLLLWIMGLVCGIRGMVRPERLRWLPAIGFGFNLTLILLGFAC